MPTDGVTPVMQQYRRIKACYPKHILLFQLGDFYEAFEHDAEVVADVCDVMLTRRTLATKPKRIQMLMAGVIHGRIDECIAALVAAGHKVAVTEQLGEPVRGLVPREVTRIED